MTSARKPTTSIHSYLLRLVQFSLLLALAVLLIPVSSQALDEPCMPVTASGRPIKPSSTPIKKIGVILVEFPGIPNTYTQSDVISMLSERQPGVPFSAFEIYRASSRNRFQPEFGTRPNGAPAIFGPYLVNRAPGQKCASQYTRWSDEAGALAASDGYKRKRLDHTVYIFPPRTEIGCPVTGIGEVLGDTTWLFGLEVSSFVHELGHNLGLFHSGRRDQSGPRRQYGDYSSPMAAFQPDPPLFSAVNIADLDWFNAGEIESLSRGTSTRKTVFALERNRDTSLPRAIKIPLADGSSYIISFRQELPEAPSSRSRSYVRGATIHRGFGLSRTTAYMATLGDGALFIDERNNVSITQISHTADVVTIDIGGAAAPSERSRGCYVVDPCTVAVEGRTPVVSDCRGFVADLQPAEFVQTPRCPTRVGGEDFDLDGLSDASLPSSDGDGDGVPNEEDCSPSSAALYRRYGFSDTDNDGRYESILAPGAAVCGSIQTPTSYLAESQIDTCPTLSDPSHVDNDRDGVGDLCQLEDPQASSRRRILPAVQSLDRAASKLQSLKAGKAPSQLLARASSAAIKSLLSTAASEPALSVPKQQELRSISKRLAKSGKERAAGTALRATVAEILQ